MRKSNIIKTQRLFLRLLTKNDVDLIWPHLSNPEIPKNMAWEAHEDKKETIKFLERIEKEMVNEKTLHWAILFNKSFCGIISLISIIRKHRSLRYDKAELAYWLGPEYRGKGIMTEAGFAVIDYAFNKLGFNRLTVSHFLQNRASETLIKKWKFSYIGTEHEAFQKNGRWYDHKLYELLEKDYRKNTD